ncbi:MAG: carbamoyl transferase [Proteobacteria bacterium]|nr:carbamoyl transferase [Pseudomonadota bacterium]MCP4920332.1 carbamoyl transferase [Pseudomonadota bacterium]
MSAVLGLSGYFHDSAAALVIDGQLVAAAQEERFSRRKNDASFPIRATRWCLESAGLSLGDLTTVVWHEKPLLKLERVLLTSLRTWPRSSTTFRRSMVSMFGDKLWVKSHIVEQLGVDSSIVRFSDHHASHAAAAYLCGPFEDAAVLCLDGVGEWATTSRWKASDGALEPLGEQHFPHSLGLLYSVFTAFLGFRVNEGEYKVMGLAAFGEPRFGEEIAKVFRLHDDGSFELDMDYFCFHREPDRSYTSKLEELFGPPRAPGAPLEQVHKDIAASIQRACEETMLKLAARLHQETGASSLCLAGGVALNSVGIGRLLRESPFDDVFVQPAAGDAGSAVGAALLAAGAPRTAIARPGWGQSIDADSAGAYLRDGGIAHTDHGDGIAAEVARRLSEGQVVGWMQGAFELGPRALGHRSILCDPRKPEDKDRLNNKVKFREPFRPFAPSVLAEASPDLFELPSGGAWTRRFMTSCAPVKSDDIAAATHVDGTARLQEVHADTQPLYAELLREFGERTGVPCLVNTSFNLAGEPIVNTPADGYGTFLRCGMDALAIGPYLVTRD